MSILRSTYAKIIISTILGTIGIAGGIYLGFALTGERPQTPWSAAPPPEPEFPPEKRPVFEAGDLFPTVDCIDVDGNTTNFERVIDGRPTAFLFVQYGCGPCYELLRFWVEEIDPILIPQAQVVICLPDDAGEPPTPYENLIHGKTVVKYAKNLFQKTYNFVLYPTVVTVDKSGFIQHIQLGFDQTLDIEVYRVMTRSGR
ncbi:MAG TPA: hypothetical protein VN285_03275 [Candidatus Deferrimicrobium sp.]|nr:hypothetical protein [Candidatus Deferrimicrobium sp.]